MSNVYVPATEPEAWKSLLAEPDKQWREGYSAKKLACCWQRADGFPKTVKKVLAEVPQFNDIVMLLAIPEHQVPLPGGVRPSQNDVWCLARSIDSLVSIAVEGKVSEPFGPRISEWREDSSSGKEKRLAFLCKTLELDNPPPEQVRYQLLHRTCSAMLEAKRFFAKYAVILVHSFSETNEGFQDYQSFISLFGQAKGAVDKTVDLGLRDGIHLFSAWVREV